MKLELSYIQKTQHRKAWPQRGRESTLTAIHLCHRPRIPFGHVLIELICASKHCKRGCNKEKKEPTHHKQQKRYRFKNTKQSNKTCENCDPMTPELSYIQNTQQRKAWPQRGGESTLTAIHSCHRTRIPVGHVLIERFCVIKHCKRAGCNREKKDQPTTNNKKGTVSKNTKSKQQNVWELWSDDTRVVVYSKYTTAEGVATEREREYTYSFPR